jgi:hypothetical protein
MRGHIPAQEGDENDRNEAADDAADSFCALGVEFAAKAGTNLAADEPAECAANNKAENCQDGCANEQPDIIPGDGRPNADGKETADGAYDSPSERAHAGFTKTWFPHRAKISQNCSKSNRRGRG